MFVSLGKNIHNSLEFESRGVQLTVYQIYCAMYERNTTGNTSIHFYVITLIWFIMSRIHCRHRSTASKHRL